MKEKIPWKLFFTIFIFIFLKILGGAFPLSKAQTLLKPSESGLTFPFNLKTSTLAFKLLSTGEKKFKIVLEKKTVVSTKIKVYDILGNLITEDLIKPEDGSQKSFDFSHINSKLFVVEVGNSKYNRTKSIYAQPQGSPKDDTETSLQDKTF